MINAPLTLADQPIDTSKYTSYDPCQLPKLIMGFMIKNKYDEHRFRLKSIAKPKNIMHLVGDDNMLTPVFFHGVELSPRRQVSHLCSIIQQAMPITTESYKNILQYNRLSCDNCARYLRDGVYPIDMSCVSTLSTNKYNNDFLYLRSLLDSDESLPWFSNWNDFNIFMPCPSFLTKQQYK